MDMYRSNSGFDGRFQERETYSKELKLRSAQLWECPRQEGNHIGSLGVSLTCNEKDTKRLTS